VGTPKTVHGNFPSFGVFVSQDSQECSPFYLIGELHFSLLKNPLKIKRCCRTLMLSKV
jgi:hypothetical protein